MSYGILIREAANGDLIIGGHGWSIFGAGAFRVYFARVTSGGALLWGNAFDFGPSGDGLILHDCVEDPSSGIIYFISEYFS